MGKIIFYNRTLLCKIVEKIGRKKINGIDWNPITSDSELSNIRKVLEILTKENIIPSNYAQLAKNVHEGDLAFIMELLSIIKNVSPLRSN